MINLVELVCYLNWPSDKNSTQWQKFCDTQSIVFAFLKIINSKFVVFHCLLLNYLKGAKKAIFFWQGVTLDMLYWGQLILQYINSTCHLAHSFPTFTLLLHQTVEHDYGQDKHMKFVLNLQMKHCKTFCISDIWSQTVVFWLQPWKTQNYWSLTDWQSNH